MWHGHISASRFRNAPLTTADKAGGEAEQDRSPAVPSGRNKGRRGRVFSKVCGVNSLHVACVNAQHLLLSTVLQGLRNSYNHTIILPACRQKNDSYNRSTSLLEERDRKYMIRMFVSEHSDTDVRITTGK